MKKFQLNKVTYNIPEKWEEITLKQQMKVSTDAKNISVEELKKMALLSGYANIPIEVMRKTQMNKLNKLWNYLSFLNDELPEKSITEFDYKGEHYSILSSLLKNEFQDYISIQTTLEQNKDDIWNSLPIMIAVLAKKEGESLDDYDLIERAKHFEELPITIANGVKVFFSSISKISRIHSQLFLNRDKIVQKRVEDCENTLKKLDGRGWRFRLLVGALRKYLRFIKKEWMKYSNSLALKP